MTSEKADGLMPCPCDCGGSAVLFQSSDGDVEYIHCLVCGKEGPGCYSAREAITAWNTRPAREARQAVNVPEEKQDREMAYVWAEALGIDWRGCPEKLHTLMQGFAVHRVNSSQIPAREEVSGELETLRRSLKSLLDACYQADGMEELPSCIDGSLLDDADAALQLQYPVIWSEEQVAALVARQEDSTKHPYTCGGDRSDWAHTFHAEESGEEPGQLYPTVRGWRCPACDYRQFWSHETGGAAAMNPKPAEAASGVAEKEECTDCGWQCNASDLKGGLCPECGSETLPLSQMYPDDESTPTGTAAEVGEPVEGSLQRKITPLRLEPKYQNSYDHLSKARAHEATHYLVQDSAIFPEGVAIPDALYAHPPAADVAKMREALGRIFVDGVFTKSGHCVIVSSQCDDLRTLLAALPEEPSA